MLVFVHIEKTAGTTLKFILRNSFGIEHCDSLKTKKAIFTQEDLNFAKKVFWNIKCITGHNLVEPTEHLNEDDLSFLTFLRDPISRSASYYQDHCLRGNGRIGFEDWMKDPKKHNMQTKRIAGEGDVEKAKKLLRDQYSFVGLTERFDESLKLLSIVCHEKLNLKYKKKLISQDNSIKNEILNNQESLELLKEANQSDIDLYDYVKSKLFPERLQKHQNEVKKLDLPQPYESEEIAFRHKLSVAFNKYIFKQFAKTKG